MSWINSFYSIVQGILASSISFVFFFLAGIACLPRQIITSNRFSFLFGLVGFSFLSIICFYSLQYTISLYIVFEWFSLGIGLVLIARACTLIKLLRKNLLQYLSIASKWWLAYIFLYTLIYIFLPQPDPNYYIPVNHIGNTDIFNYINITQDLFSLKDSTLASTYIHPFHLPYSDPFWAYYQTPGVFYFNAWMSLFYAGNALDAAMPILYTIVSLIGLMITYYCHHFFRCSRIIATGIAAIVLCGSFYRFIIGFYFLSSLMGTVIWLSCIIVVLRWDFSQPINKQRLPQFLIGIASPSCLLLMLYPIFFWINLPILVGIISLLVIYQSKNYSYLNRYHFPFKVFSQYIGSFSLAILIVFALIPQSISFSINSILFQANRSDVLWVLPLLSPLSLLGFPTYYGWLKSPSLLIIFAIIFLGLFYCFYHLELKKAPIKNKAPIYILALLALGSLFVYWLYYYFAGPLRYQPWKFASYFLLPLAGVFWGIFFKILAYTKHCRKIFLAILFCCLTGNFFFYYYQLPNPPLKEYNKLALLNDIASPTLITKMNNFTGTYLARFYIRHKKLHSLNYSYYSRESLTTIADNEPFFVESPRGCEFKSLSKEALSIQPIGCLYYGIPVLEFDKHYHFANNLPFIETHGLFEFFVESPANKRWEGPTASITFYVKKIILKKHPVGYFHFQVAPFSGQQRAFISWGKNHHTMIKVSSKEWIIVPYSAEDWENPKASKKLQTITFKFKLPDAKSPHELNVHSNDMRQRSLDFIQFFISSIVS
jgi:hypothetical protein